MPQAPRFFLLISDCDGITKGSCRVSKARCRGLSAQVLMGEQLQWVGLPKSLEVDTLQHAEKPLPEQLTVAHTTTSGDESAQHLERGRHPPPKVTLKGKRIGCQNAAC